VLTKDWVSFVPEVGPLAGEHLFEHPEAKAFWVAEMQERSAPGEKANKRTVLGECSVCGTQGIALVGKIPLGVKLAGTVPLHSYNASAFPSFQSGAAPEKTTHLGLCFTCGDSAARAFNYLSNSDKHKKSLVWDKDKRDSLANQTALFWLRTKHDATLQVGEAELDMEALLASVGTVLAEERSKEGTPPADEKQLSTLLNLPWKPREAGLTLDDFGFYLGVLSPNVGRIALREWIAVSLGTLKENLHKFREATRIVSSWGDPAIPQSISRILGAAEVKNPNYNRGLIRTAFLGNHPPVGLLDIAVKNIRNPNVLQDPREAWRLQALAAAIKLVFTFGQEEKMEELDSNRKTQAYLSGRLLAVLERAQLMDSDFKINATLVDRYYGAASTAPASVFGNLLRLATTAHLKEAGKAVNELMEEVMSLLDEAGGFKKTLTLAEQAEFALGFYHQRAKFRAGRKQNNTEGTAA
jgi:CRISPR-associated protein Csd1